VYGPTRRPFTQKHKHHGGNVQVFSGPDGWPLWVSDVRPGREHDITCARHHGIIATFTDIRADLPTSPTKAPTAPSTSRSRNPPTPFALSHTARNFRPTSWQLPGALTTAASNVELPGGGNKHVTSLGVDESSERWGKWTASNRWRPSSRTRR
jgi:hypothetical protein